MDLQVQGRFTPKGSHTCNWLKPKQLRLFFPEFLVRTQLIKIQRTCLPTKNRKSKQNAFAFNEIYLFSLTAGRSSSVSTLDIWKLIELN